MHMPEGTDLILRSSGLLLIAHSSVQAAASSMISNWGADSLIINYDYIYAFQLMMS